MWKEFGGFQFFSEDWCNPSNTLCFSLIFTYKAKDLCYMGEKRFSKVSVVLLVTDLILSIVCGHVLFLFLVVLFLVVLFFRLFFIKKENPKTLKIFKKTKMFYFVSCFICFWGLHEIWYLSWFRTCLTLWRNLNSVCVI